MKRFLSIILALLSAFVLASCKGTNDKDAQNTAPPHSAASETAAPTETPTAAPETEAPMADLNPRPDPVTVEWLAAEMQCRYYVGFGSIRFQFDVYHRVANLRFLEFGQSRI